MFVTQQQLMNTLGPNTRSASNSLFDFGLSYFTFLGISFLLSLKWEELDTVLFKELISL